MIIENVDWQLTSVCNRKCKYCFGPSHIQSLTKDEIFKIIDCLSSNGVNQLGITGGEPLLCPDIEEIINYAVNVGLSIYLSTNCDYYYFKYAKLIKEKVSIIGIPIDGSNVEIHDSLRGQGSFENIKSVLNDILNSDSKIKIKFGTVLTNCNQNDLIAIEKFISVYSSKIIFWKLYEMITYSRNLSGTEELCCVGTVKKNHLGQFLDKKKIIDDTKIKRNKSYFFLKPNGDVFVPELMQYISNEYIIGNLLVDDLSSKIEKLKYIYQQQHYFIDRHDSMAEKFINVLLAEVTALTIILLLTSDIPNDNSICTVAKYVGIVLYVITFSITLTKLLLVVRPLSKLAKDINNNELVKDENKKWIKSSLIYYQGINLHRKTALENENPPTETFISELTDENLSKDIVQQIFILAQYSKYKSELIQKSVKWVIGTTILGVVVTVVLIVL